MTIKQINEKIIHNSFSNFVNSDYLLDEDRFYKEFEHGLIESFDKKSFSNKLLNFCQELENVIDEAHEENWDGYDSQPINNDSFNYAINFITSYPQTFPFPEISVTPDGNIIFDWIEKPGWLFSVIISPESEIIYSGLFGSERNKGIIYFSNKIPSAVLNNLKKVFSD